MTAQPLVTVYITNHNYARYLRQSIDSVLSQKFSDFELIIIDDGSTDDSASVIAEYEHQPQTRVVNQENRGLAVANNIALRMARGQYIVRLDADDYFDDNALLVMSNYLKTHPDVGLVFPDYYTVDADGEIIALQRRHDFQRDVTLYDQPAHGAGTMIRRDCLLELGGYNEQFTRQDGYELWLRFIQRYRVANVNLPLFYYRHHPNSLTRDESGLLQARREIMEHALRADAVLDVLCIVPVRGTQFDPDSVVFRELAGRPVLDFTIEAALEAKGVSDIVVITSDSVAMEYVRRRYGDCVWVIERPQQLSRMNTPLESTLGYGLERWVERAGRTPEALLMLYAEAPFRSAKHVDMAIDALRLFSTDCVVGVRPHQEVFYQHNGAGLVPVQRNRTLRLERDHLYRETAGMHLVRTAFFQQHRRVVGGRIGHVVVDERAGLVIRSEHDLVLANRLVDGPTVSGPESGQS